MNQSRSNPSKVRCSIRFDNETLEDITDEADNKESSDKSSTSALIGFHCTLEPEVVKQFIDHAPIM